MDYKFGVKMFTKRNFNPKSHWMRERQEGENQMILDADQRDYEDVQCPECMIT